MHGSADDLDGLDRVNPVATIRAAASSANATPDARARSGHRGGPRTLDERGVRTPDLGGGHSTTAVVDALLDVLEVPAAKDTGVDAALVGGS